MNEISTQTQNTALSTGAEYDPFAQYAREAGGDRRPFLAFNKGHWFLGQDKAKIGEGEEFAVNMLGLEIGWVKWFGGQPVDTRMGLLVEGFRPPSRDQLGDTDKELWEVQKDEQTGQETPRDPWQKTNKLPMRRLKDGEEVAYNASSTGGIGAIATLCAAYAKERLKRPGMIPVVTNTTDSYQHRDKTVGMVFVPQFPIVRWIKDEPAEEAPAPEAEKPAPKKRAGF